MPSARTLIERKTRKTTVDLPPLKGFWETIPFCALMRSQPLLNEQA
jgi:hypothetical protein